MDNFSGDLFLDLWAKSTRLMKLLQLSSVKIQNNLCLLVYSSFTEGVVYRFSSFELSDSMRNYIFSLLAFNKVCRTPTMTVPLKHSSFVWELNDSLL